MLIQTKPKKTGAPVEAVQFLGDPSVHPQIFWDADPHTKPHWRIGGENHGGPYDSGSKYLTMGDWIVGRGDVRLVHAEEFERDWQLVTPNVEFSGSAQGVSNTSEGGCSASAGTEGSAS